MPINNAVKAARALINKYGTRDPFELAEAVGATVIRWDGFSRLKGMYRVILRNRYIFVSASLPEYTAQIVCAHELGHDRLHRDKATGDIMGENSLFDLSSRPEYEANMFAAELLISDSDILPLISERYSAEEIAAKLGTDVNLVALKVEALADAGYNLRTAEHENDFLK